MMSTKPASALVPGAAWLPVARPAPIASSRSPDCWPGNPPTSPRKAPASFNPLTPNEHLHVDISYLNIAGTFYFLCSILDGCSRFIVHWEPIQIVLGGRAVARLVPVDELTEVEKENILQEGWIAVEQARARNKGRTAREIDKAVAAAVHRVRADQ
jgi:hypothetical protein